MGFFSWNTVDTNRSIANVNSGRKTFTVFVLQPNGLPTIKEEAYDGYGVFGGYDVYALFAKWNVPDKCNGDVEHDRLVGIDYYFANKEHKFPIKIVENPYTTYEETIGESSQCNYQGFFYPDEEDEE